jgi:uncharacterized repeat protein (TIGR01451 family)
VLTWSLSPLASARIEPQLVSIRRSDAPTPGPSIRTSARTASSSGVIAVPAGFINETDAFAAIVPAAFNPAGGTFTLDQRFGTAFRFAVTGSGGTTSGALTFQGFQLSFDVPNDEAPQVTNTYAVADTSVVMLGASDTFTQRLVHQNRIGTTSISATVHIDGLGDATGSGQVVVCDCSGPVVVKRLLGPATVQPGDVVPYDIAVFNTTSSPLGNVIVTDDLALDGQPLSTTAIPFASIEPDTVVTQQISVTAPFGGGLLANTVSAPGFTAIQPPPVMISSPTGGLVITELVLSPQQDWNDSTGGNAVPFDDVPGSGAIDANDLWVELSSGTTGTESWQLCLTGTGGTLVCQSLGPVTTTSQTRLKTGWGPLTLPVVQVQVIDQNGIVRQSIDITAIEAALGPATGITDEALAWSVSGSPTPILQQLLRRPATINRFLPF